MKTPSAITWRRTWEVALVILLLAIVWRVGQGRLEQWSGPAGSLTNDLFIPAVMMNAGHGFRNVEAMQIPELRAFLDFQQQSFDVALIPDDISLAPLHPYQEFHRYLIYSTALVWRLRGINWDAMKTLILIYFFLACLAVYGISRLGMNPVFSFMVAAAFAHAPPVLWTLPVLRDFAKAPFVLATAFLLGMVISRVLSRRKFLLIALLLGLVLGIGMGIRRDMMVFLPISVFFLFAGVIRLQGYALYTRLFAVIILMLTFLLAGWPIHRSLAREGYLAAHDTIMGFSSFSDHELGILRPASYEKHYLLNDMYSTVKAHYAAGLGATFPEETYQMRANEPDFDFEMKSAYVRTIVRTFPADMLIRAYAAVLRTVTGIVPTPTGIEKYGLLFTALGLLLIALSQPLRAWLVLAMLCYFCGYTSMQFAIRHAFHTCFVPFFFMGLTIHHAGNAGLRIARRTKAENGVPLNVPLRRSFVYALTWVLLTIAAFYLPLWAARQMQYGKVRALRDAYAASELAPVAHETLPWDGRTLFAPVERIRAEDFHGRGLLEDFETGVLVAAFDNVAAPLELSAVFEWEGGIGDFGGPLNLAIDSPDTSIPAKLFFPVHEKTACNPDWSRFVGLAVSDDAASSFQGFYQVKKLKDLRLLVNMLLPEDKERFLYSQSLEIPWRGASWQPYPAATDFDPMTADGEIREHIASGDYETAIAKAAETLKQRPGSLVFTLLLAEALELTEQVEKAREAYSALLEMFPDAPVLYARLDRYFDERGGARRRFRAWSAIIEHNPACVAIGQQYVNRAVFDLETTRQAEEPETAPE